MIEKSTNPAPNAMDGLEELARTLTVGSQEAMTNEEVEDGMKGETVITEMDDGSVEVDMSGKPEVADLSLDFNENLAEILDAVDPEYLTTLAGDLESEFDNDLTSRQDWERTYIKGLKLLGLKYEARTEPWPNACGAFSSILTEGVVRFQAETIMETFPAQGPVKTQILGKKTSEKEAAAGRVKEDMNNELCNVMLEYRPEHEKMLWNLPIAGSAFKKVYEDPALGRATSQFVPAEDLILPYGASDIFMAPRVTHRMRITKNDLLKFQASGFYRDVEIGDPAPERNDIQEQKDEESGYSSVNDNRYTLLEMHADIDLQHFEDTDNDGKNTGIQLPYVITILKDSGTILSIRRNWRESDPLKLKRQHFVHYQYVPGFGAYGFGLLHLVGSSTEAATSLLRQLVDAGTLSNLPGGMKTKGLRILGGDVPVRPGEFKDVDIASGTIRDNILPLPYKEPSATLLALMDKITEDARRFAATADMKISDMSAQAPVGTTLAILERSMKVMSAVQARVHAALKQEFRLIADIIKDNLSTDPQYDYDVDGEEGRRAKSKDYETTDIIPVSDPNAATMSQRVVQYQAALQMAEKAPQIYNQPYLHRQMLDVLGIKNADKILPLPEDARPQDPVTENMNVMRNKPLKAFAYQDHAAHIQVHQSFMQDPQMMALIGQNPQAQLMMASLHAHIAEHAAFQYRAQIEQAMGIPLPHIDDEDDAPVNPEDEKPLSAMIAQAAQRVLTLNQAQAAMAQNQEAQQNPEIQLEQQKLANQAAETERKKLDDQYDYEVRKEKNRLEAQKIAGEQRIKTVQTVLDAKNKQADRQLRNRDSVVKAFSAARAPNRKPGEKK